MRPHACQARLIVARFFTALTFLPAGALLAAPSVADFMGYAKYDSAKISPQGTRLAFTQRTAEAERLTVVPMPRLDKSESSSFGKDIDVANFVWANETRILMEPYRRFPGFTTYKARTGEIFGLDSNGSKFEVLFGFMAGKMQTGTKIAQRQDVQAAAQILDKSPGDPSHVIIQTFGYGMKGDYNSVYRMNVDTGYTDRVATSPIRNGQFMLDNHHRVALVRGVNDEGTLQVFHRKDARQDWKLVSSMERQNGGLLPFAHASSDGEFFALDNRDAPTEAIVAWQPETGQQRLLFRNPEADIESAQWDPSGFPWAFRYVDHFPKYWYPKPEHPLAKLHVALRGMFRDSDVTLTSVTDDLATAVAKVLGPRNPGTFYVVDVKTQKLTHELKAFPALAREELSAVEPIELTARDGLKIRGYLTVKDPKAKRVPLVVIVHGGPYGVYDEWTFDPEAQLFASRGYAVLQVNFRGSGGRGRVFENAGFREWGTKMQDDVTDAVKWAIQDGVADARRVCIYGASYGAYAALEGVVREPDLYRCAIGMSGVYDLPLMYERGDIQSVERGENFLKDALGTDMEELKRRSPVYNAAKIRIPVLLIHGEQDQRAPFEHAKRMRAALEKTGQKPEWMSEWGEAHGVFGDKERTETYERILTFLEKNLAPTPP